MHGARLNPLNWVSLDDKAHLSQTRLGRDRPCRCPPQILIEKMAYPRLLTSECAGRYKNMYPP